MSSSLNPKLEKLKQWKDGGLPGVLVSGLKKMVDKINAIIDALGPLGGVGGDGTTQGSIEHYVTVAEEGTGFIRVYKATGPLTLGTRVDTDADL